MEDGITQFYFPAFFWLSLSIYTYTYMHTREKQCLNQVHLDVQSGVKRKSAVLQDEESWVNRDRCWRSLTEDSNPETFPLMKFRLETVVLGLGPEVHWLLFKSIENLSGTWVILCVGGPLESAFILIWAVVLLLIETCSNPVLRCCSVAQSCPTLLEPHELQPARLLRPWDSPGKNTGVGCHASSRGSSWPRNRIWVSCIDRQILYCWATREVR